MAVTLKWLLTESKITNLKLLTCHDQTDVIITGVNTIDNPDSAHWLKAGELVLTTGFIFQNDTSLQLKTISDIKNAGCSALAIKTKRYLQEVPKEMLEYAEKISLPIFELPLQYSLSDISSIVSQPLYQNHLAEFVKEQRFFNSLFNAYFHGTNMNNILEIIAQYIEQTVVIIEEKQLIPWYFSFHSDLKSPAPDKPIKIQKFEVNNKNLPLEHHYQCACIETSAYKGEIYYIPFSLQQYSLGIICSTPDEIPWNSLYQAMQIIDFSRNSLNNYYSDSNNYYEPFLKYLLNTESVKESSIVQLYAYYGIPQHQKAICIVIKNSDSQKTFHAPSVIDYFKELMHEHKIPANSLFTAFDKKMLCIFIFNKNNVNLHELQACLERLNNEKPELILGISPLHYDVLINSFQKALFMTSLNNYFKDKNFFPFQNYLIYWQISQMNDKTKQEILDFTIKPLIHYDEMNQSDLIETLNSYFDSNLNSSQAATKLFIHRNTFLKRIAKMQEILNANFDDANYLASLQLGLSIYRTIK